MKHFVLALLLSLIAVPLFAQHSAALAWTFAQGTGDPATGFHCQRSAVTGGPYAIVATVTSATTLTCSDLTVVAGQTYFYVVTAFNSAGDGPVSNEAKATIPIAVPGAPTTLTVTVK